MSLSYCMKKSYLWLIIILILLILGVFLFLYVRPSLSPPTQSVVLLIMAEDGEIEEVINTYLTRRCPKGFVIGSIEVKDGVKHYVSFHCA